MSSGPPKRRKSSAEQSEAAARVAPCRDSSRGPRIQRLLADAGVASRRACEELILEGRVEVNGVPVIDLPLFIDPNQDTVHIDGKPIQLKAERHIYILLNKPPRTLTTVADEPGADRRTVLDLVEHPSRARLFPVGRLDYDTTGLLLLTNDGELANRLTHPRFGVEKTYRAVVKGLIHDEDTQRLERGIYLAERREGLTVGAARTAHVQIHVVKRDRDRSTLQITLKEGRNRQVRRMLASVGCPVKRLERIAMGPLELKGIARGNWRELTQPEIHGLRRATRKPNAGSPATNTQGTASRTRRGGSKATTGKPSTPRAPGPRGSTPRPPKGSRRPSQ